MSSSTRIWSTSSSSPTLSCSLSRNDTRSQRVSIINAPGPGAGLRDPDEPVTRPVAVSDGALRVWTGAVAVPVPRRSALLSRLSVCGGPCGGRVAAVGPASAACAAEGVGVDRLSEVAGVGPHGVDPPRKKVMLPWRER